MPPGKYLKFKSIYAPKTSPGRIVPKTGGASGDDVFSKGVIHPGIDAREFDKTLQKEWQPIFRKRMQDAMSQAAQVSGHGA
jgi:hypothetical protein